MSLSGPRRASGEIGPLVPTTDLAAPCTRGGMREPTGAEPVPWDEVFSWRGHLKIPAAIVGIFLLIVGIGLLFTSVGIEVRPPFGERLGSITECGTVVAPNSGPYSKCNDLLATRAWQVVVAVVLGLGTGDKGN